MRSGWQVYALLLLPVIYLIVFCYIPMGGLVLAFKKYGTTLVLTQESLIRTNLKQKERCA